MSKETNINDLDQVRVERLEKNGHYSSLLERLDLLVSKLHYSNNMTKQEGIEFITLCKYFIKNGHTESLRIRCNYYLEKYIKGKGL